MPQYTAPAAIGETSLATTATITSSINLMPASACPNATMTWA